MSRPSRAQFLNEERPGPLTISTSLPAADACELYRRIAAPERPSFLLESGKGDAVVSRYSFLGTDPSLVLAGRGARYELRTRTRTTIHDGDPFAALAGLLRASRLERPAGLPPFFGGAVGYFSYDLVRRFESLPSLAADDLQTPDLEFAFVELLAALDHQDQKMHLIFSPPIERLLGESRDKLYREGCERLAELEAKLGTNLPREAACSELVIQPDQTRDAYMDRVRACQEYIAAGDIYQANLSHRFTIGSSEGLDRGQGRALYARLRAVNPSPFAALLEFDGVTLVSSSPERLVKLEGRRVETRPIAGTRPRGRTAAEDARLADELLGNTKERAEHLMLVDLERNDLGRVCRYGTVRPDEFMAIERYSHVTHIVSNITGELRPDRDGLDVIRALFPGGTITGVPKIRCMEIIEALEPVRRGPYTGSLGYISWAGELDLNIIIRTLVLAREHAYLQVGAGIVADSDPGREYEETLFKAEALLQALKL
jgi:para-aminobenzoate synthetase component 1